ncbi:hypothetical protein MNBD_GAMMA08-1544 [hydrothermal vent metagenome]|uniref:Uncharacterized protein n=1 Tax=hydrothermal vent metagenome TaxID=652676 RepID=A0A3B0XBK4_9ZZZZ
MNILGFIMSLALFIVPFVVLVFWAAKYKTKLVNAYWDDEIHKNPSNEHLLNMYREFEFENPSGAEEEINRHVQIKIQEYIMHEEYNSTKDNIDEKYKLRRGN